MMYPCFDHTKNTICYDKNFFKNFQNINNLVVTINLKIEGQAEMKEASCLRHGAMAMINALMGLWNHIKENHPGN